jgi:hypothetical protein
MGDTCTTTFGWIKKGYVMDRIYTVTSAIYSIGLDSLEF